MRFLYFPVIFFLPFLLVHELSISFIHYTLHNHGDDRKMRKVKMKFCEVIHQLGWIFCICCSNSTYTHIRRHSFVFDCHSLIKLSTILCLMYQQERFSMFFHQFLILKISIKHKKKRNEDIFTLYIQHLSALLV